MSEIKSTLTIDSSPDVRAGRHADTVLATTKDGETRLDFVNIDQESADPEVSSFGSLAARIYMSNRTLEALRDMLNRHIASWGESDGDQL